MKKILIAAVLVMGIQLMLPTGVQAQTDPTLKAFLGMLDGSETSAEKAVKAHCSVEVIENGMIPYGKSPKIVSQNQNCYIVDLDDDGEVNSYEFCLEDNKITSFDWYYEDDGSDDSDADDSDDSDE